MLHINARVIAFFRRFSNLMDEKRGREKKNVIERENGSESVRNNLFLVKRVREFEVIFSWRLKTHYSCTSVRAAMAKVNDLPNRREFNLTLPSQNGNN